MPVSKYCSIYGEKSHEYYLESSSKSTDKNGVERTFTSSDKYVGETANAIESKFPGRVVGVNQITLRQNGSILTDFDIELDSIVIQVKSGTGKGLTSQMQRTATGTTKTVIGYTPDLTPSSALVKGAKNAGFDVFTTLKDLLNFIASH
ncbi:MAG: hypothetical protein LBV08_10095 [Clostridiales bacterium]|jgi:hypothetical protein|nr:hypothetical protein [Clostridiales bacterium]